MNGTLILSARAFNTIERDCRTHPTTETGGILVGQRLGADLVVPFAVPAGPQAHRALSCFRPDSLQQLYLDWIFDRFGLDYIGDYHRHPGSFDRPSGQDLHTARWIVTDPAWEKIEAVFPIIVFKNDRLRMRSFFISRSLLEFVEIPTQAVSDSDQRVTAVLMCHEKASMEGRNYDKPFAAHRHRKPGTLGRTLRALATRLRHHKIGRRSHPDPE